MEPRNPRAERSSTIERSVYQQVQRPCMSPPQVESERREPKSRARKTVTTLTRFQAEWDISPANICEFGNFTRKVLACASSSVSASVWPLVKVKLHVSV